MANGINSGLDLGPMKGTVDGVEYEIGELRDVDGRVEKVALSLKLCGCGRSYRRPGVGYYTAAGYVCKDCGELLAPKTTDTAYQREQSRIIAEIEDQNKAHPFETTLRVLERGREHVAAGWCKVTLGIGADGALINDELEMSKAVQVCARGGVVKAALEINGLPSAKTATNALERAVRRLSMYSSVSGFNDGYTTTQQDVFNLYGHAISEVRGWGNQLLLDEAPAGA